MKNPKGKFYTVRFTYFETGEVKIREFYRVRIGRTIRAQVEKDGYSMAYNGLRFSVTIESVNTVLEELKMRLDAIKRTPYGAKYQYANMAFDCNRIQACMSLLGVYHVDDIKGFNYDYCDK